MSILLKVKDLSDAKTNFEFIESHQIESSEIQQIFETYFKKSNSTHKVLHVIYPNHTEIYTEHRIFYCKRHWL